MNDKVSVWTARIGFLMLFSVIALKVKKRLMLVDLQKLGEEAVANPPWYYAKMHCSDMYSAVQWGGDFCIAIDLRLVALLPIAIFTLGIGLFMWLDRKQRVK